MYSNTPSYYGAGTLLSFLFLAENSVNWQTIVLNFIENSIEKEIQNYTENKRLDALPFVTTMPYVILAFNWLAFLPQFFVSFSTIVIPFFLTTVFFTYANLLGLAKTGTNYLKFFCPVNGEYWLRPIVFTVEIFAYTAKYLSLALRLFSNILSGHVILEVLGTGVIIFLFSASYIALILTLILTTALYILELFIAFAQAFLFVILTIMYGRDFDER